MNTTNKMSSGVATGIIKTITESTYSDFPSLVREISCNAIDANADKLLALSTKKSIYFMDNGKGLNYEAIVNNLLYVGHSFSSDDETKIGKFGIGIFSLFPTCDEFVVFSRTEKDNWSGAKVDSKSIFLDENKAKPIETVLKIDSIDFGMFEAITNEDEVCFSELLTLINDNNINTVIMARKINSKGKLFLSKNILTDNNKNNIEKIRKILPLQVSETDDIFSDLNETSKTNLKNIFNDYCNKHIKIEWFYIDPEFNKLENTNLDFSHKYKPFKTSYKIDVINPIKINNISFAGYFVKSVGAIENWEEIDLRINNTKIIDATALAKSLRRQYPQNKYITGELYVKGLKKYLKITRDSFADTSKNFKDFVDKLKSVIDEKSKPQEKKRDILKKAEHFFVDEQNALTHSIEKSLENSFRIIDDLSNEEKKDALSEVSAQLSNKLKLDKTKNLQDVIKNKKNKVIAIKEVDNEQIYIEIVDEELEHPKLSKDDNIQISASMFKSKTIDLKEYGQYEIIYKKGNSTDPSVDLDFNNNKIYVNLFNEKVISYEKSIFEVETLLAIAYATTSPNDKAKFYEKSLEFLRGVKKVTKNIFSENMEALG